MAYFNYERTIQDHIPRCSNEVQIGNMIDHPRITGGYWKEQRRRRLECFLHHSTKIKKELDEMEKADKQEKGQLEQDCEKEDSKSEII